MSVHDHKPMPVMAGIKAAAGRHCVSVSWLEGVRAGRCEVVDLSPLIDKFKLYEPIRDNDAAFHSLELVDDGRTIEWLGGVVDMAATSVERLAGEQMTGEDFRRFLERNHLTRHAAAAELGRSLRAVQAYVKSAEPIPRVVALACRGFEAGRNADVAIGYSAQITANWQTPARTQSK